MDLSRPIVLTVDTVKDVTAIFDDTTACLQAADGTKSVYLIVQLPANADPYIIAAASIPLGTTLFSPRLFMLDQDGRVRREIPNAAFVFRGSALHAAIRVHASDRYLVVASDPYSVGSQDSRIYTNTRSTLAPVGTGFIAIHSGEESVKTFTYAHNGRLTISVQALPKIN